MARRERVNVPVDAEHYPKLKELAQEVGRPAGAVVYELVAMFGAEYRARWRAARKVLEGGTPMDAARKARREGKG